LLFDLLEVIKMLSRRPSPLRWILLGNGATLAQNRSYGNILQLIRTWWDDHMPHVGPLYVWDMNARDCGLPQQRHRLFLVALDREVELAGGVPLPPQPMAPVRLEDFLLQVLPDEKVNYALTVKQRENLHTYHKQFSAHDSEEQLAVIDVGRSPDNNFNSRLHVGRCPTLTTSNVYLHVLSKNKVQGMTR
jgi:site-specific DNA-cytosine methylase